MTADADHGARPDTYSTLVPGDRVLFNRHEWEVFIAGYDQRDDSAICIFRYRTPGRASVVEDLMRQRCELVLIPRRPSPNDGSRT
jgi:hypothetical protein